MASRNQKLFVVIPSRGKRLIALDETTCYGVYATADISPDARLVSCPFDLAVTSERAREAVCSLLSIPAGDLTWPAGSRHAGEEWNHRMLIGAYLGMHWVHTEDKGCQVYVSCPCLLSAMLGHAGTRKLYADRQGSNSLPTSSTPSISSLYPRKVTCKRPCTSRRMSESCCRAQICMAPPRTGYESGKRNPRLCGLC